MMIRYILWECYIYIYMDSELVYVYFWDCDIYVYIMVLELWNSYDGLGLPSQCLSK